jgi:uncharacterized protein (DUF58 family)
MALRARVTLSGLIILVLTAGTLAAVSVASTASGHQNPRYLVTATLTPTTVSVHGDFWATVTVKNTDAVRRTLQVDYAVTKPGSGSGTAFPAVQLRPGQVWKRMFNVPAGARGRYSLTIRAHDGLGTSKAIAQGRAG